MNCQTFRTIVHEIDVPDGLEPSALDAALGHAQACGRCARQLHQARELMLSLQTLARADWHRQASPVTEARLVEAFRAQRGGRSSSAWRRWLAAAAVLVLTAGAGLLWLYAFSSARHPVEHALVLVSAPPSSPAQLTPALTAPPPGRSAPDSAARDEGGKRVNSVRPQGQAPAPADFIPLPFADQDAPLGSGEVVRISLSEGDLVMLGLPVSEDARARSFTADVMIGEDGIARAIRFVSSSQN